MDKIKTFLGFFRSPHIVVIALVAASTALTMMIEPDKAAFMFLCCISLWLYRGGSIGDADKS